MSEARFKAITLQYDGQAAPRVTAKGEGYLAQQIVQTAEAHKIPIKQDSELLGLLSQVQLDQEIPEKLYQAVVQVLLFAYQLSGKTPPAPPTSQTDAE
ncbi:MAG: EscU/YscU/HrcU family type III secretion system export apparatus switch protein [Thiotrichales bacterium]|nr:EscU/YscU/HrcU family type III secretion system export apparatus switch protein [Thiotrichales bacterium]